MGSGVGGRSKREGVHVYKELIDFIIQQKLTRHYKAIILNKTHRYPSQTPWTQIHTQYMLLIYKLKTHKHTHTDTHTHMLPEYTYTHKSLSGRSSASPLSTSRPGAGCGLGCRLGGPHLSWARVPCRHSSTARGPATTPLGGSPVPDMA